jgi:hypothetical protein
VPTKRTRRAPHRRNGREGGLTAAEYYQIIARLRSEHRTLSTEEVRLFRTAPKGGLVEILTRKHLEAARQARMTPAEREAERRQERERSHRHTVDWAKGIGQRIKSGDPTVPSDLVGWIRKTFDIEIQSDGVVIDHRKERP